MSAKILVSTENMPYEQWLEYRRKGIGGSDASVVCGINRYKSPVELWMEKTNQIPYTEAGESAYWGTQLEAIVRNEFTLRTDIEVKCLNQILQSKEYPFMLANLDGVCEDPDYGSCIFEAKTASAYKADEWNNTIPEEYQLQIQHYMAVTGYKGAYIAVLIGGNTFKWQFVKRDEELIKLLICMETDFWKNVQSNTLPPLDGSEASVKFLSEKYPESNKLSIKLPDIAAELILKHNAVTEQLNIISEEKQKIENELKQLLAENETGMTDVGIITWKTVLQERFNTQTFKLDYPDLYRQYLNKTSYRRFSIKNIN